MMWHVFSFHHVRVVHVAAPWHTSAAYQTDHSGSSSCSTLHADVDDPLRVTDETRTLGLMVSSPHHRCSR